MQLISEPYHPQLEPYIYETQTTHTNFSKMPPLQISKHAEEEIVHSSRRFIFLTLLGLLGLWIWYKRKQTYKKLTLFYPWYFAPLDLEPLPQRDWYRFQRGGPETQVREIEVYIDGRQATRFTHTQRDIPLERVCYGLIRDGEGVRDILSREMALVRRTNRAPLPPRRGRERVGKMASCGLQRVRWPRRECYIEPPRITRCRGRRVERGVAETAFGFWSMPRITQGELDMDAFVPGGMPHLRWKRKIKARGLGRSGFDGERLGGIVGVLDFFTPF